MPPLIVAFTGKAGAGKDTAANLLVEEYGFDQINFADTLREVCALVFGLTHEEMTDRVLKEKPLDRWPYQSPRQILQTVGVMFREAYPGAWIRSYLRKAEQSGRVATADCRFPDEADAILSLDRHNLIFRVKRPNHSSAQGEAATHESEMHVDSLPANGEIVNDADLCSFRQKVRYHMSWNGIEPLYVPPAGRDENWGR